MGFCYTDDGLLCCDFCGRSRRSGFERELRSDTPKRGYHAVIDEGDGRTWHIYHKEWIKPHHKILYYARRVKFAVRRIRCPYGWCQPWATCTDCRLKGLHKIPSCFGREGQTHKSVCKSRSEASRRGEQVPITVRVMGVAA